MRRKRSCCYTHSLSFLSQSTSASQPPTGPSLPATGLSFLLSFCWLHYWPQCPGHFSSLSLSTGIKEPFWQPGRARWLLQKERLSWGMGGGLLVFQHILKRFSEQPFIVRKLGMAQVSLQGLSNSGWWPSVTGRPHVKSRDTLPPSGSAAAVLRGPRHSDVWCHLTKGPRRASAPNGPRDSSSEILGQAG